MPQDVERGEGGMFEAEKLRRNAENMPRFVRKCLAVADFFTNT
jgi:hypothetical protein